MVYKLKNVASITIYPAKKVSEELNIQPSTLRKYSGLVDKLNQKPYFNRDATNARIYDDVSLNLLKRIMTLNNLPDMTLENSIEIALLEEKTKDKESNITAVDISSMSLKNSDIALIQSFFSNVITKQAEEYTEKNRQVIDSAISPVYKSLEVLLNQLQDSDKKMNELIEENKKIKDEITAHQKTIKGLIEEKNQSLFGKIFNRKK